MIPIFRSAFLAFFAALLPGLTHAAPSSCPQHFAGGQAPDLLNSRLAVRTADLCYTAFAVEHSGVTRTPLWSAEHLTADQVAAARQIPREGTFHAESALPEDQRARLGDYVRSGYQRGHMSPSGDMPTPAAQEESFTLANMVPQAPRLNRGLWEGIESAVRDLAVQDGQVYVVTGPVFKGNQLQSLGGRVLVPTFVFKAVYDPARGSAAAYIAQNTDDTGYRVLSIAQLAQLTGIDVFPSLPAAIKARAVSLPAPNSHYAGRKRRAPGPSLLDTIIRTLVGDMTR